jgi:hypothetical protein
MQCTETNVIFCFNFSDVYELQQSILVLENYVRSLSYETLKQKTTTITILYEFTNTTLFNELRFILNTM